MKIDRSHIIEELFQFSQEGNGVIIGKPGIGKSYSIATNENEAIVLEAVVLLNGLMKNKVGKATSFDVEKLTAIIALEVAVDFTKTTSRLRDYERKASQLSSLITKE